VTNIASSDSAMTTPWGKPWDSHVSACDAATRAMGPVPQRRVLGGSSSSSSHTKSTSQLLQVPSASSPIKFSIPVLSPTRSKTTLTPGASSFQPSDDVHLSSPPNRRPISTRQREAQMTPPVATRDPIFRKSVSRSVNRSILECFHRDPGLVGDDPLLNGGHDESIRLASPDKTMWDSSPLPDLCDSEDEFDMAPSNDLSTLVKLEYARRKSRSQPSTPVRIMPGAAESPERPAFQLGLTPVQEQGETPFRDGN
jgi:hypothetical protein